jgi:hypothetical protein
MPKMLSPQLRRFALVGNYGSLEQNSTRGLVVNLDRHRGDGR